MAATTKQPTKAQLKREEAQFKAVIKKNLTALMAASRPATLSAYDQQQQEQTQKPPSNQIKAIYTKVKELFEESDYLRTYLNMKVSVWNYDLSFSALDPSKNENLQKWLLTLAKAPVESFHDIVTNTDIKVESTENNLERMNRFVSNAWMEKLMYEACIAFWMDGQEDANVLNLQRCDYRRVFNVEIVRYTHGYSQQDRALLDPEVAKRFEKPVVVLNAAEGEYYKVWKESPVYAPQFEAPAIYSIFRLLAQVISMQVGQNRMATMLRTVSRLHKLGHQIDQGNHSGKPFHFWTKKWGDAVKLQWDKLEGIADRTTRHDHTIEYPWPDPKLFDLVMFSGVSDRFAKWGGPLAQMMNAGSIDKTMLTNLLKAEAQKDRRNFGIFLDAVLNLAFKPPTPITCTWSNTIFNEPRLGMEMMNGMSQRGQVSNRTVRREFGVTEAELDYKLAEAQDANVVENSRPLWDTSHALAPALGETAATMAKDAASVKAAGKQEKAGRKAGSPNTT